MPSKANYHIIKVLSVEYAKAHPGLEASIKKWDSVVRALGELRDAANKHCGLCIEHRYACGACPYGKCLGKYGSYAGDLKEFANALGKAGHYAVKIRTELLSLRKQQK